MSGAKNESANAPEEKSADQPKLSDEQLEDAAGGRAHWDVAYVTSMAQYSNSASNSSGLTGVTDRKRNG